MFETLRSAARPVFAPRGRWCPVRCLRIEREDLFDQLADHVDLLQGIFSALLRAESTPVAAAQAGA